MTRADIEAVIEQIPGLTAYGVFRITKPEFRRDQEELLESVNEFSLACEWLKLLEKTNRNRINKSVGSYFLKHLIENDTGDYIGNGTLIAAAVHCGFAYRINKRNPNAYFGITQKSLKPALDRYRQKV